MYHLTSSRQLIIDHESLDSFMESGTPEDIKVAKTGKQKISSLKQKLIFYMAFIKGRTQRDLTPIKDEVMNTHI